MADTTTALVKVPGWLATVLTDAGLALQIADIVVGVKPATTVSASVATGTNVLTEIGNLVPKLPVDLPTAAVDAAAALATDVGAVVTAENSPEIQAARLQSALQSFLAKDDEDLKRAQATGDTTQIDKDSSG